MCGVVGAILVGESASTDTEVLRRNTLEALFASILKQTEERGKDATGIATCFQNGDFCGLKMGVAAETFLAREGEGTTFFDGYMKKVNDHASPMSMMIGHCRKSSVGNDDNVNNHPVRCGNIVGVHNGTLTNHEVVFEQLGGKRDGSVDTEAIFRLVEKFTSDNEPSELSHLQEVQRRLKGTFTTLSFNGNVPRQLTVIKDTRPLDLCFIKSQNILLVASDDKFIKAAIYYHNLMTRMELSFEGATQIKDDDREFKIFPNMHVGLINANVEGDSINDFLTTERFKGEKLWQVKEYASHSRTTGAVYSHTHNNTNTGSTNVNVKPDTTPATTKNTQDKPEEKKSTTTDPDPDDLMWVSGLAEYRHESGATLETASKRGTVVIGSIGNSSTINVQDAVSDKVTLTSSDDAPSYTTISNDDEGDEELMFVKVVSPAALMSAGTDVTSELVVIATDNDTVDDKGDDSKEFIDHLKSVMGAEEQTSQLPVFTSDKDVAEYLTLEGEDVALLGNLPVYMVATQLYRMIYKTAYNKGVRSALEEGEKKSQQTKSSVAMAKHLAMLMSEGLHPDNLPKEVTLFAKKAGPNYKAAFQRLFTQKDLEKYESLRAIGDAIDR